jgi:hypothetical protein
MSLLTPRSRSLSALNGTRRHSRSDPRTNRYSYIAQLGGVYLSDAIPGILLGAASNNDGSKSVVATVQYA